MFLATAVLFFAVLGAAAASPNENEGPAKAVPAFLCVCGCNDYCSTSFDGPGVRGSDPVVLTEIQCECGCKDPSPNSHRPGGYDCFDHAPDPTPVATPVALRTPLPCGTSDSERRLSVPQSSAGASGTGTGHAVHVLPGGQIERSEVAAALEHALDGESGFEALVNSGSDHPNQLLVLQKDQMQYENDQVTNPDGPFALQNAFIMSDPDTQYRLVCPAASPGAMCQVYDVNGGAPWFGECVLEEEYPIADSCLDSQYEVSLFSLKDSHFLLGATSQHRDCPSMVFFAGNGGKLRVRFSPEGATGVAIHAVGEASLRAVIEAEARTPGLDKAPFDLATNTCLHYAGGISRNLGLPESAELGNFIVENIVAHRSGNAIAKNLVVEAPRDDYFVVGGVDRLPHLLAVAVCSLGVALNVLKDCYSAARAGSSLSRDKIESAVYSSLRL